ncbi:glutathione S-transferase C-terminal domain-containing protein [Streptomyces sp. NPDC091377]|uniref:glutathione S-transferase C-terminal domain-containing protein n=1 Tax=Streptomyces sp. NPDC091377 TaxID=3365995 RepID=UPI003804FAEC
MTQSMFSREISSEGRFLRQGNRFTHRVTADGSSGFPVEPGRYHLIASPACPWSHRVIITRRLLGLEDAIGLSVVDPVWGEDGWVFATPDGRDPATGLTGVAEAYRANDPRHGGRSTLPLLYDAKSQRIVSNDFRRIPLDLATEWTEFHAADAPQLYPRELRAEVDSLSELIYNDLADGVYRCGLATTEDAYQDAYEQLFNRLDWLQMVASVRRYLLEPDRITDVDIQLFVVLVRFDAVYHDLFRCDRQRLTDFPLLWAYARDLFQLPHFGDTVDFAEIQRHYHHTYQWLSSTGTVPAEPDRDEWLTAHGREDMPQMPQ